MAMGGLHYEEFSVGMRFEHVLRRTVTEADNLFFSALTHNPAALHLDEEYMKGTEFGSRIVNSCFTLSLMVGVSVGWALAEELADSDDEQEEGADAGG